MVSINFYSDLIFNNTWNKDLLVNGDGNYSFNSFSTIIDSIDDNDKYNGSASMKGIYIIEKAISEGRALDLFINLNDIS